MKEYGLIVGLDKKFAKVRIGRNSACASCGKCGMTENQKHVDFYAENTVDAKVGDTVELEIPEANNIPQLALVAYLLPLIPALILMFVAISFWQEWLGVVMFFVGYALGFAVVALIDRAKRHNWTQMPTILQIVNAKLSQDIIEDENKE